MVVKSILKLVESYRLKNSMDKHLNYKHTGFLFPLKATEYHITTTARTEIRRRFQQETKMKLC